MKMAEGRQSYY